MALFVRFQRVLFLHLVFIGIIFLTLEYAFPSSFRCFCSAVGGIVLFLLLTFPTFTFTRRIFLNDRVRPYNKAVLITGCDSGFGHILAKRLDSKGYHVLAGCLFPSASGAQQLRSECSSRLNILDLDVTRDESVVKAFELAKEKLGSLELWAVVNNAGILKGMDFDFSTIQDFKDCLEVNFLGMIRVTKAFLPLLKKSEGRVVNITSFAGRVAFIGMAPYVTSKFATVGFNDILRHELNVWRIRVISVEPELFRTQLVNVEDSDKQIDAIVASLDPDVRNDYSDSYFKSLKESRRNYLKQMSSNVHIAIDDIESAISLAHPNVVYRPYSNLINRWFVDLYGILPPAYQDMLIRYLGKRSETPSRLQKTKTKTE